jgi:hypothetical protein
MRAIEVETTARHLRTNGQLSPRRNEAAGESKLHTERLVRLTHDKLQRLGRESHDGPTGRPLRSGGSSRRSDPKSTRTLLFGFARYREDVAGGGSRRWMTEQRFVEHAARQGLPVEINRHPRQHGVLELAQKGDQDMIVLTTHGRSGLSRWFLGSVTEAVVRASGDPVLIIPPKPARVAR